MPAEREGDAPRRDRSPGLAVGPTQDHDLEAVPVPGQIISRQEPERGWLVGEPERGGSLRVEREIELLVPAERRLREEEAHANVELGLGRHVEA